MFFYRATETNLYKFIFCKNRKEKGLNSFRKSMNSSETFEDSFLDPEQPLTAMITKTINYEFLTCIVYGLSSIFQKIDKKNNQLRSSKAKETINLGDTNYKINYDSFISKTSSLYNNQLKT